MKIEVRSSPIHGRGVFAKQVIKVGERIGRYTGPLTEQDGMHVFWVEYEDGWRGYQGRGRLRFLNHRANPNAEFEGLDLFAVKPIHAEEEITIHYGEDWADA